MSVVGERIAVLSHANDSPLCEQFNLKRGLMDLPGQAETTLSALQQVKADLKQWEREFQTQHSHPPSKADVQACASIQQLYREYARLKMKVGKENVQTEKKIHVKPDPGDLVTEVGNDAGLFPLARNRLLSPRPASPSDNSSGISATAPKLVSTKGELQPLGVTPSSVTRRPLQSLPQNNSNIPPTQLKSNQISSTRKSEAGGKFQGKITTNVATAAPKKLSLRPAEVLSSSTAAPHEMNFLPGCPLAVEGGLVIRLQRHGARLNDRQSSLLDDPLPAGFFSRSGPSSLVRKDLEARSVTAAEDGITRDGNNGNPGPATAAASRGDNHMKSQGTLGESAHRPGFGFDQPQCADVAAGNQTSTPSSAAGNEQLADLQSDEPSDFAKCRKNEIRKTTGDLDDASMDKKGLQKLTVVGLKQLLLKQGLPLAGSKSTLLRRLEDALSTEEQIGLPSIESTHLKSHLRMQAHKETTCPPYTKLLKRRLDDQGHEQLPEKTSNTGNSVSPKPARKYFLRSKGLPTAKQHETESGKVGIPASVTMDPVMCSAGEGHKVSVVKSNTKRVKVTESFQENSWGNPEVLRKGARSVKGRNQVPGKSRQRLCTRRGERDNFVRLNINGKGGKSRRFVNGTRTRRPGAYGRRGMQGTKFRKRGRMDAPMTSFKYEGNECRLEGNGEVGRNRTGHTANSLWANDGWLETDSSPKGLEDSNGSSTDGLNVGLKDAVEKAQKSPSDKNLIQLLDLVFGFNTFRTGQLEAIKRVLSLQSTMVVLPTGAGKSLCYQFPAHLLPGITLVISPLIALMTDQLGHLPPSLPGALISSAQTPQESSATISRLRAGQVKVLFISPERLLSENFLCTLGELPTISFAVIDEAHCLSEWSHNFRPSYFRLGKVLHQRMNVSCVLALTATATKKAEQSILKSLCIPDAGVVQASNVRQNLSLSVSWETNRLKSLLSLLHSSPYAEAKSIIIYCTFQLEADNISGFLDKNGIQAKSYHAKKTSQERTRIYDLFRRNKLKAVVATVAFGMGLDKSDVRAIIHYNMPRSLEHYVQETGRAGRDGTAAYCHLFLDDGDFLKLRSLTYSDGVDEYSVNKFLCRVFDGCSTPAGPGNLVSIIIDTASRELDTKEEVMETILSLLEVGDVEYVKVLSKINATCTLSFHQSNPTSLAGRNIFVAAIMKRKQKQGRYIFDLPTIATQLKWSLFQVQSELRRLQIPTDICLLTSKITKRLAEVEQCQVRKLDAMYLAASAAVRTMNWAAPQDSNITISSQQDSLQSYIKSYFEGEEDMSISKKVPTCIQSNRSFVRADIKVFLKSARNPLMTSRAVARIFHGLWSPAFPYSEWSKSHFWGLHTGVDFEIIKGVAAAEILSQHAANRDDFQL